MSSTFDIAAARSVRINGLRYICLTDTISIMGGDTDAQDVMDGFLALPEQYRAVQDLMSDSSTSESLPVVRMEGLVLFMRSSPQAWLSAAVYGILLGAFEGMAAVSASSQSGSTRWGEQPFRELIRGYHQSMSEITALLNKHTAPDEKRITQASLSACAMGRQIPNPVMLRCLARVLTASPSEMFTREVLAAHERKHGTPPSSATPALVAAPLAPVSAPPSALFPAATFEGTSEEDFFAPSPSLEPEPEPEPEPEYDQDAEDAKMYAAFSEVLGTTPEEVMREMAATSFEAGFSTITGSPSAPQDPEVTSDSD